MKYFFIPINENFMRLSQNNPASFLEIFQQLVIFIHSCWKITTPRIFFLKYTKNHQVEHKSLFPQKKTSVCVFANSSLTPAGRGTPRPIRVRNRKSYVCEPRRWRPSCGPPRWWSGPGLGTSCPASGRRTCSWSVLKAERSLTPGHLYRPGAAGCIRQTHPELPASSPAGCRWSGGPPAGHLSPLRALNTGTYLTTQQNRLSISSTSTQALWYDTPVTVFYPSLPSVNHIIHNSSRGSPVRPVAVLLLSSSPLTDWTVTLYVCPGCSEPNVTSLWCLRTGRTSSCLSCLNRNTEYPSTSPWPGVQLTFKLLLSPLLLTWMFFTLLGTEERRDQSSCFTFSLSAYKNTAGQFQSGAATINPDNLHQQSVLRPAGRTRHI